MSVLDPTGQNGKGLWYNPIGITLKADSKNAIELQGVIDKVKGLIGNTEGFDKFNLESPSDMAKALLTYVLNSEEDSESEPSE